MNSKTIEMFTTKLEKNKNKRKSFSFTGHQHKAPGAHTFLRASHVRVLEQVDRLATAPFLLSQSGACIRDGNTFWFDTKDCYITWSFYNRVTECLLSVRSRFHTKLFRGFCLSHSGAYHNAGSPYSGPSQTSGIEASRLSRRKCGGFMT